MIDSATPGSRAALRAGPAGWRAHAVLAACVMAVLLVSLTHLDGIRGRAGEALGRGMPEREAQLARGFVLGQDDRVDTLTREDFRRSGLAHLLAVSGQNVALLALLAMPVLGLLGMPLRARLLWVLALIACYVPLAGAGPSIQRAGVMGGLSVLATLAGRRPSRFYAFAVAMVVTLAIDPGIAADVGWQLSFAAVLGIFLLAAPIRAALTARALAPGSLARTLCDGVAMTLAATIATAPLIAFHFGQVPVLTLLANLLVLPAVAPAMWLGMLAAAGGQAPGFPVEMLNGLNAPLLAYIAQVATWCGRPDWACLEVDLSGAGLAVSYVAVAVVTFAALRLARSRRIAGLRRRDRRIAGSQSLPALSRLPRAAIVAATLGLAALLALPGGRDLSAAPAAGLRVSVFDVGQGDAILFQPAGAPPLLVDGGPPGQRLAAELAGSGVDRLAAAVITHDQSDHAGGIEELLGAIPVGRLLYAAAGRDVLLAAHAAGVPTQRVAKGAQLHDGGLRLEAVWPPAELLPGRGEDPNHLALVMLARWRDFSMLLTADAEAESTPLDPGPVDVLKVAHHGSEDSGLGPLLDRIRPKLAVISVGDDNPYGHPTAQTLAVLASHGVRTLRTDQDGTVTLDVSRGGVTVHAVG
ncbi:MAG TPA: ComEC/Rec2 family competence protein [Solirubrobacterales bacterium]|nr:ComEC/Rec2 family competence protein [Solirubrobacterales bacterium]